MCAMQAMTVCPQSQVAPFKSLAKGLGGRNPAGSTPAVTLTISGTAERSGDSCCHTRQDALLKGHEGSLGAAKPWPSPAFCRATVGCCVCCCVSRDAGKEEKHCSLISHTAQWRCWHGWVASHGVTSGLAALFELLTRLHAPQACKILHQARLCQLKVHSPLMPVLLHYKLGRELSMKSQKPPLAYLKGSSATGWALMWGCGKPMRLLPSSSKSESPPALQILSACPCGCPPKLCAG